MFVGRDIIKLFREVRCCQAVRDLVNFRVCDLHGCKDNDEQIVRIYLAGGSLARMKALDYYWLMQTLPQTST